MMLSSKLHYAIALAYLRDAAKANLTLKEKRQLQRRAARFAELSREQPCLRPRKASSQKPRCRHCPCGLSLPMSLKGRYATLRERRLQLRLVFALGCLVVRRPSASY